MVDNPKNEEVVVTERAVSRRTLAATSMTGVLIISCLTMLGAQQQGSTSSHSSSGNATAQNALTVPAGTRMLVRMIDPVDSEKNRTNDRFRGVLEADLMAGDALVAPRGTTVYGRLLTVESAGRTSGGELELDITEILIDGTLHSLTTSSKQVQGAEGSSTAAQTARGPEQEQQLERLSVLERDSAPEPARLPETSRAAVLVEKK